MWLEKQLKVIYFHKGQLQLFRLCEGVIFENLSYGTYKKIPAK